jgi:hypothetical protein
MLTEAQRQTFDRIVALLHEATDEPGCFLREWENRP